MTNPTNHPYIYRDGRSLMLGPPPASDFLTRIPPGQYRVNASQKVGLFLTEYDPPEMPAKIYGDLSQYSRRVIKTFNSRNRTTGVMLKGEKGSGKSLLSQVMCRDLVDAGIPVLLINEGYPGQVLSAYLENFKQPIAVFIDEFEKVYDKMDVQQTLLPLMDGASGSNLLFILTINKENISEFLVNRPGRIFYTRSFSGLELSFICEFAKDRLKDKSKLGDVVLNSSGLHGLSFDGLQAIIEEMNRYGESFQEANQYLRLYKGSYGGNFSFRVSKLVVGGEEISSDRLSSATVGGASNLAACYLSMFYYKNPEILLGGNCGHHRVGKLASQPDVLSFLPAGKALEEELRKKDSFDPNVEVPPDTLDLRSTLSSLNSLSEKDGEIDEYNLKYMNRRVAQTPSTTVWGSRIQEGIKSLSPEKGVSDEVKATLEKNLALLMGEAVVVGFAAARDFNQVDFSTGELEFVNPKGDLLRLSRVEHSTIGDLDSYRASSAVKAQQKEMAQQVMHDDADEPLFDVDNEEEAGIDNLDGPPKASKLITLARAIKSGEAVIQADNPPGVSEQGARGFTASLNSMFDKWKNK